MTPTPRGWVLLTVALALFGMAWLTQIGWFYVADSLVWGILAVNLFLPWLTVRDLHVFRQAAGPSPEIGLFEDDPLTVTLSVKNLSFYPKDSLTIHDNCPLAPPHQSPPNPPLFRPLPLRPFPVLLSGLLLPTRRLHPSLRPRRVLRPLRPLPLPPSLSRPPSAHRISPPHSPARPVPPQQPLGQPLLQHPPRIHRRFQRHAPVPAGRPAPQHPLAKLRPPRSSYGQGVR